MRCLDFFLLFLVFPDHHVHHRTTSMLNIELLTTVLIAERRGQLDYEDFFMKSFFCHVLFTKLTDNFLFYSRNVIHTARLLDACPMCMETIGRVRNTFILLALIDCISLLVVAVNILFGMAKPFGSIIKVVIINSPTRINCFDFNIQ